MRITVSGIYTEISTKRKYNPASGKDNTARTFNAYLDTLQQKVFEAKRKLIENL
jgi:hypothetical protein